MIDIKEECARYQTTSQSITDQVRVIIKKGLFSDLELLEICHKIDRKRRQQNTNSITHPTNNGKQVQSNRNEPVAEKTSYFCLAR